MAALSTALSDVALAASAGYATYRLAPLNPLAASGFLLISIAAALGVWRFGSSGPPAGIVRAHGTASWLASVLGMACLAAAYSHLYRYTTLTLLPLLTALVTILLNTFVASKAMATLSELASSSAVILVCVLNMYYLNWYGVVGSVVYIVAGLAVGTTGHTAGVPSIDVFHYLLVFANVSLMLGVMPRDTAVLYNHVKAE